MLSPWHSQCGFVEFQRMTCLWYGRQNLRSSFHIIAHDSGLVLYQREQQRVAGDPKLLREQSTSA